VPDPNFATNLRRLIHFEHRSGKEAAAALGVTEATISRWITGRRYPSAEALIKIDRRYGISPRDLDSDPVEFAQRLADPDRMAASAGTTQGGEVVVFDDWLMDARAERAKKVEERVQKRGASTKRRGAKK
jgi:transcriptional regulator with XRE-family HTH domain